MKYSEIHEALYGGSVLRPLGTLNLDLGRRLAWVEILTLEGRGGFDHWWDEIEEEDKDELFEELVSAFGTQPLLP